VKQIPAGGEGNVNIKVFTTGYGGRTIVKGAEIYSNDPDHPRVFLKISGIVEQLVSITPRWIRMVGAAGDPLKSVVRIVAEAEDDLMILDVSAQSGENIRYHLEKDPDEQKSTYVLTVENLKETKGWYSDSIYLKTSSVEQPMIEIKVNANILAPKDNVRR